MQDWLSKQILSTTLFSKNYKVIILYNGDLYRYLRRVISSAEESQKKIIQKLS